MKPYLPASWLDLAEFDNSDFDPGRGILIRTLWHFISAIFLRTACSRSMD